MVWKEAVHWFETEIVFTYRCISFEGKLNRRCYRAIGLDGVFEFASTDSIDLVDLIKRIVLSRVEWLS